MKRSSFYDPRWEVLNDACVPSLWQSVAQDTGRTGHLRSFPRPSNCSLVQQRSAVGLVVSLTQGTGSSFAARGEHCLQLRASWTTYRNGLKYWKPVTNGQRFRVTIDRREIYPHGPFRPLTKGLRKTGGRNQTGRITCWHRGGGCKRLYRFVDFKREKETMKGEIQRIEYDPNRTGYIALVKYQRGEQLGDVYSYVLAPQTLKVGDVIASGAQAPLKPGNTLKLTNIPTGMKIHNIELTPGRGGQMSRSAGCFSTLVQKGEDGYATLRLPSG